MPSDGHPGRMYTISAATAPGSEDLWAVFSALRLLEEAADAVGGACVQTSQLMDDAHWQNKGVQALRWRLSELHAQLVSESDELRFEHDSLASAVLP